MSLQLTKKVDIADKQKLNQLKVQDLSVNIGLLISRLLDEELLFAKFPDKLVCDKVWLVMDNVVSIFLGRDVEYCQLPKQYTSEKWRCLRLLREIFELKANSDFSIGSQTLDSIHDLIECYKDSEPKYMSI